MSKLTNYYRLLKRAISNLANINEYIQDIVRYQLTKQFMTNSVMNSQDIGISNNIYGNRELIVSLTTYGKRINTVYQSIESIFNQTYKANKIVLYISKDHFTTSTLPHSLLKQQKRGLEIRFVKDIGPYTKLIPALKEFPNANIITIDDDYMYPFDMIEKLVKAHLLNPQAICCHNSRIMSLKKDNEFNTYNSFKLSLPHDHSVSHTYLAEGFGGVLYPAHSLYKDITNEDLFLKLSPHADDLWYKAMEILNKTIVLQIARDKSWFKNITREESVQDTGLININITNNKNDIQLKAIFDYYNIYPDYIQLSKNN